MDTRYRVVIADVLEDELGPEHGVLGELADVDALGAGNVHVADVGQLVVHLVRAAVEGRPTNRDDLWDENGIYIPSVGEMVR